MKRLVDLIGMSVGGWLGWTAGVPVSYFTAFIVGVVGTGLGLYAVRRLTRGLL
jgi:phosphate/sulfate permease